MSTEAVKGHFLFTSKIDLSRLYKRKGMKGILSFILILRTFGENATIVITNLPNEASRYLESQIARSLEISGKTFGFSSSPNLPVKSRLARSKHKHLTGISKQNGGLLSQTIRVNVALYGSLASRLGKRYVATEDIELPTGTRKAELLQMLGISNENRGYLFINAVLCDVPGLHTGDGQVLENGDHIGIFSVDRIWPYQYRDGVRMSPALAEAMEKHGPMHHSYNLEPGDASINKTQSEELQNG